jgi:hypothetical protein
MMFVIGYLQHFDFMTRKTSRIDYRRRRKRKILLSFLVLVIISANLKVI